MLEIAHIGQAGCTQWTQLWQFKMSGINLSHICNAADYQISSNNTRDRHVQPREGPSGRETYSASEGNIMRWKISEGFTLNFRPL